MHKFREDFLLCKTKKNCQINKLKLLESTFMMKGWSEISCGSVASQKTGNTHRHLAS